MHLEVAFQDDRLDLDIAEERLVAAWSGPPGVAPADLIAQLNEALERPRDFPPLRQAVVPGDRVVIALGADLPGTGESVAAICRVLEEAGVAPQDTTVLAEPEAPEELDLRIPPGVIFRRHDPDDRERIAYLANTTEGRRIYLDRDVTDADFVVPVGRLAYDRVLGHTGPWGVIFPGLSDSETRQAYRMRAAAGRPGQTLKGPVLGESVEVSWKLGCQFQLGLVPGVTGVAGVVAGLGATVIEQGSLAVERFWGFQPESRAELVVVGIGRPGVPSGIDDLAHGLANATQLVQHGGKIVVLSRAGGKFGPALRRLRNVDDPRAALAALKGREADSDFPAASQIAQALAWADVYLLSALDPNLVEEVSMIPLDRPEDARRLAATSGSCLVVSHADLARASVAGEAG
jgi:lactate racemase